MGQVNWRQFLFDHTMYPGIGIDWPQISGIGIGIDWYQSSGIGIGWNFGIGTSLMLAIQNFWSKDNNFNFQSELYP